MKQLANIEIGTYGKLNVTNGYTWGYCYGHIVSIDWLPMYNQLADWKLYEGSRKSC